MKIIPARLNQPVTASNSRIWVRTSNDADGDDDVDPHREVRGFVGRDATNVANVAVLRLAPGKVQT